MNFKKIKIGIVGLGYVGLPLAIEFSKKFPVIGYDTNPTRVKQLRKHFDSSREISKSEFKKIKFLTFETKISKLTECNIFIMTLPTPIKKNNVPDLNLLKLGTKSVAKIMPKYSTIIYESTVYPGCTEEVCAPIIEKYSGLKFNKEFYCGYSPERINVGDKKHSLIKVKKITSGSNPKIAKLVSNLYSKIIKAGIYSVQSIKIAEAAKVIENVQRDINIALMNEISLILDRFKINTKSVIDAAATKWNFMPFTPGLVGGHCIGIDPYYMTYIAKKKGYLPKIILAGRKINDHMSFEIGKKIIKLMKNKNIKIKNSKALIMGLTFKENCSDIRNSKVFDLISYLKNKKINIEVYDPWVNKTNGISRNFKLVKKISKKNYYDLVVIAVPHENFFNYGLEKIRKNTKKKSIIFDIKNIFNSKEVDGSL